jgi:uncharacterized protein YbaR (Trm112 family)
MKRTLLEFLVCPSCLPDEMSLHLETQDMDGFDIVSGLLRCGQCGVNYPITEGIALLVPAQNRSSSFSGKYEAPSVVSSYLWSHYGDLFEDEEAASAYMEWSGLIESRTGLALDAGCAVGRFTFQMSRKSDFAVGVDLSHAFIKQARELLTNGSLQVSLVLEGSLTQEKTIHVDKGWDTGKVEFLVADVQALPFRRSSFNTLSSLNLIDKIPLPFLHLKEMNRVAEKENAQFLLSDPFSWSTDVTGEENWLGGTGRGPFPGHGVDNVASLLKGGGGEINPPWTIGNQGHVWWKIRNHRNHFELIRSCFLNAFR